MYRSYITSIALLFAAAVAAAPTLYPYNPYSGSDKSIYLADNGLTKFSTENRQKLWHTLSNIQIDEPLAVGERVLVGSSRGVYALAAADGEVLWHIPADEVLFSPSIDAGVAYIGGQDGKLRAVTVESGTELWSIPLAGDWVYSPAIIGNTLVTGGQSAIVWGINRKNGATVWQHTLPQELVFSPVDAGNGTAIVTSFDGVVTALDVITGEATWSQQLPVASLNPTVSTGRVHLPGLDGVIRTLSLNTGSILWQRALGTPLSGRPLVHAGRLITISNSGILLLLDLATGEVIKKQQLDGEPIGGATIQGQQATIILRTHRSGIQVLSIQN